MNKLPIIKKLGLEEMFSRKLLHIKQLALGVGLILLETIIDILALKVHIRNRQINNKVNNNIKIQEEIIFLISRMKREINK